MKEFLLAVLSLFMAERNIEQYREAKRRGLPTLGWRVSLGLTLLILLALAVAGIIIWAALLK